MLWGMLCDLQEVKSNDTDDTQQTKRPIPRANAVYHTPIPKAKYGQI